MAVADAAGSDGLPAHAVIKQLKRKSMNLSHNGMRVTMIASKKVVEPVVWSGLPPLAL